MASASDGVVIKPFGRNESTKAPKTFEWPVTTVIRAELVDESVPRREPTPPVQVSGSAVSQTL